MDFFIAVCKCRSSLPSFLAAVSLPFVVCTLALLGVRSAAVVCVFSCVNYCVGHIAFHTTLYNVHTSTFLLCSIRMLYMHMFRKPTKRKSKLFLRLFFSLCKQRNSIVPGTFQLHCNSPYMGRYRSVIFPKRLILGF